VGGRRQKGASQSCCKIGEVIKGAAGKVTLTGLRPTFAKPNPNCKGWKTGRGGQNGDNTTKSRVKDTAEEKHLR